MTSSAIPQSGETRVVASAMPMTPCVVCKEDIRRNAAVCTKCKSPQNWTRYIFVWKDIGSAFLALVPLWTGAYALWSLAFKEPAAEVRAAASHCQQKRVVLDLVNDGEAPAILKLPRLKVSNAQASETKIELVPDPPLDSYLLGAKQSKSITLKSQFDGISEDLPTKSAAGDVCTLTIETGFRGFKGREGLASAQCPCPLKLKS